MKLLKQNWKFLMTKQEAGRYVGLPYNIIDYTRSELSEKVRVLFQEFKCPYILKGDNEAEDLLVDISSFISSSETGKNRLELPYGRSEEHFLQFSNNIIIHVSASDEYLGGGENETWSCIKGIIITEEITNKEVIDFVNWAKKFEK